MYEVRQMARALLAAMDSEPDRNPVLAYADSYRDMAKQGVESVPIWSVITDLERNIAPLYRHAQPVPEHPEVLPCSVLLEPGLRFGKGIKTSTMLAALARRAVYESDLAALSPEERAEFLTGIEDFKALIAQPAPVVPKSISVRQAISALESADAVTTIGQAYKIGWNACRAAMLQASPVCTCPSDDGSLRWPCPVHPGNYPVIPDGYVMVPKEPTEAMMLHNSGCQHHAWDDPDCAMRQTRRLIWSHMLAAAPQEVKGE